MWIHRDQFMTPIFLRDVRTPQDEWTTIYELNKASQFSNKNLKNNKILK